MILLRLTKTMNVDIYNFWYFAITAGIVQITTGSTIDWYTGGHNTCNFGFKDSGFHC